MKTFEHRSIDPGTAAQVMAFYADPNVLSVLTPPPIFVQMHADHRASLTEGEVDFTLWFAVIPFRWKARHEPGPVSNSFVDRMISGPMAVWVHTHLVRDVPGGVETIDRVQLEHKPGLIGLFTRLFFDGLPLRFLFIYRHFRTRLAIHKYSAVESKSA